MYFSPKTIAFVASASLLASTEVAASPLVERGSSSSSLCNKANYGASGKPWEKSSTPGSFCSSQKPGNSPAWQSIPYADGYDTVKCSTWSWSWSSWSFVKGNGLAVCNGGNKVTTLPSWTNIPHKVGSKTVYLWGLGCNGKTKTVTNTVTVVPTTTGAASSAAAASTTIASSAAASSAVASSAAASSATSTDGSLVSTILSGVSSAAAQATSAVSAVGSAVSSAAAAATTTVVPVDPSTAPLCEADFQVQYLNFTLVAPNGVWSGLTVGSAAQDASYMTYTLANTVDDCLAACDNIEGCTFVNTYYDVNAQEADLPKHTPGVLTCAMFSSCVPTSQNSNFGGQDDPNTIVNSNGYCKSAACSSSS